MSPKGHADVIQIFMSSKQELEGQLVKLKLQLAEKGILWVTYPKGTSKMNTNINRDIIRKYGHYVGFETLAIFSIDTNWAALMLKNPKIRQS